MRPEDLGIRASRRRRTRSQGPETPLGNPGHLGPLPCPTEARRGRLVARAEALQVELVEVLTRAAVLAGENASITSAAPRMR
jgi:hypothetical protein